MSCEFHLDLSDECICLLKNDLNNCCIKCKDYTEEITMEGEMITPCEVRYYDEIHNSPKVLVMHDEQGDRLYGKQIWHPARPIGRPRLSRRIIAAWWILTNRAIAVRWF